MSTNLKYGQGTIRKKESITKNGKKVFYEGRYFKDNKQYSVYAATKKECLEKLKIARKNHITKIIKKSITFGEWIEEFIETYKTPFVSISTLESIRTCKNKHISKQIKEIELNKLEILVVQKHINQIKYPRQKELTAQLIVQALKKASQLNLIKHNIASAIVVAKTKSKKSEYIQSDKLTILLEYIKNHNLEDYYRVKAYLLTGCRKEELTTITNESIDYEKNSIKINGTKTKDSLRTIPLFEELKELLKIIDKFEPWIFNFNTATFTKRFRKYCDACNLNNIVVHSLRHTFATNCLTKGIDMKVIQLWLGHSSYKTTADIYANVSNSLAEKSINLFNEI